jgi:hypothetical protein
MYLNLKSLTNFASYAQNLYDVEETELKKVFNKKINFSACYINGKKLIPYAQILDLKLGYKKPSYKIGVKEYVFYEVAFERFKRKNI